MKRVCPRFLDFFLSFNVGIHAGVKILNIKPSFHVSPPGFDLQILKHILNSQ